MKTDYKELAKLYELEAEAYAINYEDEIKPVRALMLMGAVLARMESDLIVYERKHGKNARTKGSQEKVDILKSIYEDLSTVNERNRRMKLVLMSNNARMMEMETELQRYKQQELNLTEFEQE